jgi:hypothetical protein
VVINYHAADGLEHPGLVEPDKALERPAVARLRLRHERFFLLDMNLASSEGVDHVASPLPGKARPPSTAAPGFYVIPGIIAAWNRHGYLIDNRSGKSGAPLCIYPRRLNKIRFLLDKTGGSSISCPRSKSLHGRFPALAWAREYRQGCQTGYA